MISANSKTAQGAKQPERQIREQIQRDEAGRQKSEIERKPGLSQQQEDEQREREQEVREEHEKRDDGSRLRTSRFPSPSPD
jgi:hypothetical protein